MLVGIVGAPNKGKSTLFSALTSIDVQIADYPFTTIKPNVGVAYVTKKCVDSELHVKCSPKNSMCVDGTRMIPVRIIDVAGLVEGAHEGKGMGNQFLNDISAADALVIVADASGKTDTNGNPCQGCDPVNDVEIIINEMAMWISGIIKRHSPELSRSKNALESMEGILAGLRITREQIEKALIKCGIPGSKAGWRDSDTEKFSKALLAESKPILVAANKADLPGALKNIDALKGRFGEANVVACSAAVELALRKAEKQGMISYNPSDSSVRMLKSDLPKAQADALSYMIGYIKANGTGVQQIINRIYLQMLGNIVVYPVEDENKYTDHSGNVLPDAILIKKGSTAHDLAAAIHTELANSMLYAIDAKKKMRIAKEQPLSDGDVVKIVSSAKPK